MMKKIVVGLLALIVGALNPQLPRIGWRGLQQAGQIVRFTLVALVVAAIALWLWWRRRDWLRALVAGWRELPGEGVDRPRSPWMSGCVDRPPRPRCLGSPEAH